MSMSCHLSHLTNSCLPTLQCVSLRTFSGASQDWCFLFWLRRARLWKPLQYPGVSFAFNNNVHQFHGEKQESVLIMINISLLEVLLCLKKLCSWFKWWFPTLLCGSFVSGKTLRTEEWMPGSIKSHCQTVFFFFIILSLLSFCHCVKDSHCPYTCPST